MKLINDKLENIKNQYDKIAEMLESGNGEENDLLQSEKFKNFKTFLDNRSEVLQQNLEKQDKIDILTEILDVKRTHLAVNHLFIYKIYNYFNQIWF